MLLNNPGTKKMRRQRPFLVAILIFFVFGALLPVGWLGAIWPDYCEVATTIFASPLSHILGHFIIFLLLGAAVLFIFPALRQRFWLYLGLMLLLGITQEALQLITFKHHFPALDELLDLTLDLLGALATFFLWRRVL